MQRRRPVLGAWASRAALDEFFASPQACLTSAVQFPFASGDHSHRLLERALSACQPAAEKFGRAAFAGFGPIKEVKSAKIEVFGADGKYTVTVDGGKIMKFQTQPVLGGDAKTPIGYTNIKNAVNPTVYQGTCVSATYSDGDRKVTVDKGRNAHFNPNKLVEQQREDLKEA